MTDQHTRQTPGEEDTTVSQTIVYARSDAVLAHAGQRIRIRAGEAWAAADPLVAQYPDAFSDSPRAVRVTTTEAGYAEVEQATATPGEKRATRRRPAR